LSAESSVTEANFFAFGPDSGSSPQRTSPVTNTIKHPSNISAEHVSDALLSLLDSSFRRQTADVDLAPHLKTQGSDSSENTFCLAMDNAFENLESQNLSTWDASL
jgi:hypothetical protein